MCEGMKLFLSGVALACGMVGTVEAASSLASGPVSGGNSQQQVACTVVNAGTAPIHFIKTELVGQFKAPLDQNFNDCTNRESLLPGHRQILFVFDALGAQVDTRVLTASAATFSPGLQLTDGVGGWRAMVSEGVHHILIGYDHLAFLLVLLLAVLLQAREQAEPRATTARRLLAVITAFTVAHSLTLGLSATGLVRLPSAPIEALIALSIVIAGLLNLSRERRVEGAWLAFGFGLIHGFGFAGAFAELAPGDGPVGWLTVAQFNLGVELGQLAVGLPAFALGLYVMQHVAAGPRLARHGSAMAAGLGALWFLQRTVLQ